MDPLNILMLGTQGSGKGTQSAKLAKHFGIPTFSTGEILRSEIEKGTELGKLARSYIVQGNLVPDDIISSIVRKEISKDKYSQGVILDGYPRNIVQAETLNDFLDLDYVILIDISDEEAVKRVTGRRICSKCGENYHMDYNPPEEDEICDKCGTKLDIREDSEPEAVETRLKVYHLQTEPLAGYYEEKGMLIKVDGEQPIEKVYQDILNELEKHGLHNQEN